MFDENSKKDGESEKLVELRAILEKELIALLAHPLVPEEVKKIFKEMS